VAGRMSTSECTTVSPNTDVLGIGVRTGRCSIAVPLIEET